MSTTSWARRLNTNKHFATKLLKVECKRYKPGRVLVLNSFLVLKLGTNPLRVQGQQSVNGSKTTHSSNIPYTVNNHYYDAIMRYCKLYNNRYSDTMYVIMCILNYVLYVVYRMLDIAYYALCIIHITHYITRCITVS